MVASIDSLEAPGEPPLPTGVPPSQIQGRSPWYLAWLRLRRNKVALACAVLFVLIVLFCLAAPLWAEHVAHTGPNENHLTDKVMIDGQETDVVVARRHADRTRTARPVSARRRPERPRRHGAVDVRRPHVDLRRPCGGGSDHHAGRDRRPTGRLLPGLDRLGAVPHDGRDLGLPCVAPRHRVGHHTVDRRPEGRSHRDRGRLALDSDPDHRVGLRALRGKADPRRDPRSA